MLKRINRITVLLLALAMLIVLGACKPSSAVVTVSFVTGTEEALPSITRQVGEEYGELPVVGQIGYDFAGWFTGETDGEEVTEQTIVSVKRDHTLYARWNINLLNRLDAGYNHSLAIDNDGGLWGWGDNSCGQIGDGTGIMRLSPVRIMPERSFVHVSAGYHHSLAIDDEGGLWVWGLNEFGQVGDGTTENRYSPVQIMPGTKFSYASAGERNTLAIDEAGNLWSWGNNYYGQIGNGTFSIPGNLTNDVHSPVKIAEGTRFTYAAINNREAAAIDSEGALWMWGSTNYESLDIDSGSLVLEPRKRAEGMKFSQIVLVNWCSLALDEEGMLWAWGNNANGQFGNGTTKNSSLPVSTGMYFKRIGRGARICGIDGDGNLWAWGVGVKDLTGETVNPLPIQLMQGVNCALAAAGENYFLAMDGEGNVFSCGENDYGQLGNGESARPYSPARVLKENRFACVSGGTWYSIAVDDAGDLWGWGVNDSGQLGNGTTERQYTPVRITSGYGFVYISAGYNHSLAIDGEGGLWGWGKNSVGQLGDETDQIKVRPVRIMEGTRFASVLAGGYYSLAIDDEAEIMVGSGAFYVDSDMGTSGVILSRNTDWWKGTAPSDEVVFTWNVSYINNVMGVASEEYNVYVFNDAACYDGMVNENNPLHGADTITVAENPVLLSFNLSGDSGSAFEDENYRKYFTAQLNFSGIRQNFEKLLAFESHDYWLTFLQCYSSLNLDDLSYTGVDYNNLELKFLLPAGSRFKQIIEVIRTQLDEGIRIQIDEEPQNIYEQEIEDGDYDITFVEVDLSRINSIYHTLYSQINANVDNMILASQFSDGLPTYKSTQKDIQKEMLNRAAKFNLGWTKKVIVYDKFSVDGISAPGGFHPMGDSNRIDFRWVSLSQD